MSQFMSDKFLRARRALAGETVTEDRYCEGCGYNLRGLQYGQACPECGLGSLSSGGGARTPTRDPLLTVDESVRRSMKLGFRLGSLVLLGATILVIVFFFVGTAAGPGSVVVPFVVGLCALALVWVAAVWLITPFALAEVRQVYAHVGLVCRLLAFALVLGLACTVAMQASGLPKGLRGTLGIGAVAGVLFGVVGVLITVYYVGMIAGDAGRDHAGRRCGVALWLLPIFSLLVPALFLVPWFSFGPMVGLMIIMPLAVIGAWSWGMLGASLACHELHEHVRWAFILADDSRDRETRIAEKKATIDAEVRANVRSLPDDGEREDIEVDTSKPKRYEQEGLF
jgi:hypothetical protein